MSKRNPTPGTAASAVSVALTDSAAAEALHLDDGPAPGDQIITGNARETDGALNAIIADGQPPVDNDHIAPGAEPFTHLPPSVAQALEMFAERPGLSSVLTTEGVLSRDGGLTA